MAEEVNKNSTRKDMSKVSSQKVFKIIKSPLTERFENSEDIRTIYNLFSIILISLLTNTIIHDYLHTGEVYFGLRLIIIGFNNFKTLVLCWICMFLSTCVSFVLFQVWARTRLVLPPKSYYKWDRTWVTALVLRYLVSLYLIQKLIKIIGFAPGSAAVFILEGIRLLMKEHSFIRTNAAKVINYKLHSDETLCLPSFSKFLYFSFAPTLLYRDEYPRTSRIRWKFVLANFAEVLAIIFLLSLVVERCLLPPFKDFGIRKFSKSEVIVPILANSFPGIMFMLGGFYSVLHASQNMFAELLRFGDRLFYKEWWTSRSLSQYYRTWNVVVHDWLYTYIFKDMYYIVWPKNKYAAKLTVFVVSAVFHEWIMTSCLGLFLPIQFSQFFIAGAALTLLNLLDLPVGNLVVWYCIVFGSGMQVNLYTLEFMARQNCPIENPTVLDFFLPRSVLLAKVGVKVKKVMCVNKYSSSRKIFSE